MFVGAGDNEGVGCSAWMNLLVQSSVSDISLFGGDFETFPTHLRHLPFLGGGVKLVRVV